MRVTFFVFYDDASDVQLQPSARLPISRHHLRHIIINTSIIILKCSGMRQTRTHLLPLEFSEFYIL